MRDTYKIYDWLKRKGMPLAEVARQAGVSTTLVTAYIRNRNESPRVRESLLRCGCPARLVGDSAGRATA